MTRDRRIGGVRQADFLQADAPPCLRHVLARYRREEAFEQHAIEIVAGQGGLDRSTDQSRAAAENRDGMLGFVESGWSIAFFRDAALLPQRVELHRVELRVLLGELRLDSAREREIHVVAAEQDVLADGDALKAKFAAFLGDRDQRKVGGAATDIDDEDQIADRRPARASSDGVRSRSRKLLAALRAGRCSYSPPLRQRAVSAHARRHRTRPGR